MVERAVGSQGRGVHVHERVGRRASETAFHTYAVVIEGIHRREAKRIGRKQGQFVSFDGSDHRGLTGEAPNRHVVGSKAAALHTRLISIAVWNKQFGIDREVETELLALNAVNSRFPDRLGRIVIEAIDNSRQRKDGKQHDCKHRSADNHTGFDKGLADRRIDLGRHPACFVLLHSASFFGLGRLIQLGQVDLIEQILPDGLVALNVLRNGFPLRFRELSLFVEFQFFTVRHSLAPPYKI